MRFIEPHEIGAALDGPEWTPEQLGEIYRMAREAFTVQDLVDLINHTPEEYIDSELVLATMHAKDDADDAARL